MEEGGGKGACTDGHVICMRHKSTRERKSHLVARAKKLFLFFFSGLKSRISRYSGAEKVSPPAHYRPNHGHDHNYFNYNYLPSKHEKNRKKKMFKYKLKSRGFELYTSIFSIPTFRLNNRFYPPRHRIYLRIKDPFF